MPCSRVVTPVVGMGMAVVQIGPVPMSVVGGFVRMPVGVIGTALRSPMIVCVMVIVVDVVVPMGNRIVTMGMLMSFAEEDHKGGRNDHARQRLHSRERFTEDEHREQQAEKRRR